MKFLHWLLLFYFWCDPSLWAIKASQLNLSLEIEKFSSTFIYALLGSILLAISNGILGSFLVVRQMSMLGDVLSHAVLPGLVAGVMLAGGKSFPFMIGGAIVAGALGIGAIRWIQNHTRLKSDAALGMILSGFYAIGISLLSILQHKTLIPAAGLDKILLGQAAAINPQNLWAMGIVTTTVLLTLKFFYKEWLILSFDKGFAESLGLPIRWLEGIFLGLVTVNIVVGLQASGVLLVSAMLVIPASTAYLWTKKFKHVIALSVLINLVASASGTYLSSLRPNLPTGPCMVLVAGVFFLGLWIFGPKDGWLRRWHKERHFKKQVRKENSLKAIYHFLELHPTMEPTAEISLKILAKNQSLRYESLVKDCKLLEKRGWLAFTLQTASFGIKLTPQGYKEAIRVVRKHRLWELYLASAANYPLDHVHEDAENVEHLIDDATLAKLEERLNYPTHDPHGQLIPQLGEHQENFHKSEKYL